ncbi:MAG: 50S ribosomal protein L4 [Candidatus Eremiobacteraeota bacterium]|nr:50S ribosomal protein L4 [Candidatus Eremiobacteraeota bacterium]MBV8371883.1 50S ribosomal protein L4 [Candidatus Eremiobacteraeota bacterium]
MPNVIDATGNVVREVSAPAILDRDAGDKAHVIYRAVHRELANARAGTASTKKRDEVSGGGRKPWRQKGTGRARQGSIRSPQWRHGGVAFGPQPRSFVEALNKKERKVAFVAALAERFGAGAVTLFELTEFPIRKTAEFARLIFGSAGAAKDGPRTLIVCARDEANAAAVTRVARNLRRVDVTDAGALDVKDVLRFERIVFTTNAYDALVARLSDEGGAA